MLLNLACWWWSGSFAGGTNLQLPSWTVLKETLRSYNWPQFTQLGLPRMGLTGPVGSLSFYLPQLTMLDLSHNQLTGVVPPDLSTYSGLRYVNLANNTLYGEWAMLPQLLLPAT
jgi:Leucine-rich repeat (LRR) protein